MENAARTRREFLSGAGSALGVTWITAHWPAIAAAHAHAHAAAADGGLTALASFATADARDVDAIAAQIIPTDDAPGAREPGALYFIDRSLHTDDQKVHGLGISVSARASSRELALPWS